MGKVDIHIFVQEKSVTKKCSFYNAVLENFDGEETATGTVEELERMSSEKGRKIQNIAFHLLHNFAE